MVLQNLGLAVPFGREKSENLHRTVCQRLLYHIQNIKSTGIGIEM